MKTKEIIIAEIKELNKLSHYFHVECFKPEREKVGKLRHELIELLILELNPDYKSITDWKVKSAYYDKALKTMWQLIKEKEN